MANATDNLISETSGDSGPAIVSLPVKGTTHIYKGTLVAQHSGGYLHPVFGFGRRCRRRRRPARAEQHRRGRRQARRGRDPSDLRLRERRWRRCVLGRQRSRLAGVRDRRPHRRGQLELRDPEVRRVVSRLRDRRQGPRAHRSRLRVHRERDRHPHRHPGLGRRAPRQPRRTDALSERSEEGRTLNHAVALSE